MINERDTQFWGSARALWEKMLSQTQWQGIDVTAGHIPLHHPEDEEHKIYIDLIAQHDYDLVKYTLSRIPNLIPGVLTIDEIMSFIPDPTKLGE